MLIHAGSSRRVPAPPEKRFLISQSILFLGVHRGLNGYYEHLIHRAG
jgi:hypothetical protein